MTDETRKTATGAENGPQEAADGAAGVNTQPQEKAPQEATQDAQNKQEEVKGTYTHSFKKEFDYGGKKFKALTFYWDRLTGRDMISIENEMQAMNEYAIAPEMSASFLCRMAAKASGVDLDFLEHLPIGEFSKIKNEARSFLIGSGY